jgi:hypothetical protein
VPFYRTMPYHFRQWVRPVPTVHKGYAFYLGKIRHRALKLFSIASDNCTLVSNTIIPHHLLGAPSPPHVYTKSFGHHQPCSEFPRSNRKPGPSLLPFSKFLLLELGLSPTQHHTSFHHPSEFQSREVPSVISCHRLMRRGCRQAFFKDVA